jgi:uncharacterized protein
VRPRVLVDTGPLVALVDRRDGYHSWAKAQVEDIDPPLYTCESVLTEACFLLRHLPGGSQAILDLVQKGLVQVELSLQGEVSDIKRLLMRYADVPMALADACMVRLSELSADSVLWTLDSDFKIYRRNGRAAIPLLMPEDR